MGWATKAPTNQGETANITRTVRKGKENSLPGLL